MPRATTKQPLPYVKNDTRHLAGVQNLQAIMDVPGYDLLADVMQRAYDQAAKGKGKERHANDLPFELQPMASINRQLGTIDGFIYQAHKKSLEAKNLPHGRAQAELLGAINYLAGAVIALDGWAAGTLPANTGETGQG